MSSLASIGVEESLKSDVAPGTHKTDGRHSTHPCVDKSVNGDILRLPLPILRGPCRAVMPNFMHLHGSSRVFNEPTTPQKKKILFSAPTRSHLDSHIMDSPP